MVPPPRHDNKKSKDAGRASASRNTTPSSGAGISGNPISSMAQFGLEIPELAQFKPILETHAGPGTPDSNTIGRLSEKSARILVQSKKSSEELRSGLARLEEVKNVIVEGFQADDRNAVAAATERTNKKAKTKVRKPSSIPDRPLTHGAHAVAAQDGSQKGT